MSASEQATKALGTVALVEMEIIESQRAEIDRLARALDEAIADTVVAECENDHLRKQRDALTAMVKRLMDEGRDAVCAGKFSYEASVFGRAVLEARALIGEDGKHG